MQNCTPLAILHARVLCSKFSFLLKVTQGNNSLSCRVFRSLAASEVESIQLVRQCWFLESQYGSNLTSDILTDPMSFSTAALKKDILWLDRSRLLADASTAPHLKHIVDVDTDPECNWLRVWDLALDRGPNGTSCALAMLKLLGLQSFSGNCPFDSCEHNLGNEHLGSHFLSIHTELSVTLSDCELALKNLYDEIFTHGQGLYELFLCRDYV